MTHKEIEKQAKEIVSNGFALLAQADMYNDFEGNEVQSVYLGSVLSIMPSGKFYMPWATSNIDPCPRCNGTGKSKKYEPCRYCNGDGTRTVSQIAEIRGTDDYRMVQASLHNDTGVTWVDDLMEVFECNGCQGKGFVYLDCTHCQGHGSREVLEDEWMREALEKEADKYDCFVESGEGDLCDMFLTRVISDASESEEEDGA